MRRTESFNWDNDLNCIIFQIEWNVPFHSLPFYILLYIFGQFFDESCHTHTYTHTNETHKVWCMHWQNWKHIWLVWWNVVEPFTQEIMHFSQCWKNDFYHRFWMLEVNWIEIESTYNLEEGISSPNINSYFGKMWTTHFRNNDKKNANTLQCLRKKQIITILNWNASLSVVNKHTLLNSSHSNTKLNP